MSTSSSLEPIGSSSVSSSVSQKEDEAKITENSAIKKIEAALAVDGLTLDDITDVKGTFKKIDRRSDSIAITTYRAPEKKGGKVLSSTNHIQFEMEWEITLSEGPPIKIQDIIYTNVELPKENVNLFRIEKAKSLALQAASTYQEIVGAAMNPQDPLHDVYKGQINALREDGCIYLEGEPTIWASNQKIDVGYPQPYQLTPWANVQIGSDEQASPERFDYLVRVTEKATSEIFRDGAVSIRPRDSVLHRLRCHAANAQLVVGQSRMDPYVAELDHIDHLDPAKAIRGQIGQMTARDLFQNLVQKIQKDELKFKQLLTDVYDANILKIDEKVFGIGLRRSVKKVGSQILLFPRTVYRAIRKTTTEPRPRLELLEEAYRANNQKMQNLLPKGTVCADPGDLEALKTIIDDDTRFNQVKGELLPLIQQRASLEPHLLKYRDYDQHLKDLIQSMERKVAVITTFSREPENASQLALYQQEIAKLQTIIDNCKKAALIP